MKLLYLTNLVSGSSRKALMLHTLQLYLCRYATHDMPIKPNRSRSPERPRLFLIPSCPLRRMLPVVSNPNPKHQLPFHLYSSEAQQFPTWYLHHKQYAPDMSQRPALLE